MTHKVGPSVTAGQLGWNAENWLGAWSPEELEGRQGRVPGFEPGPEDCPPGRHCVAPVTPEVGSVAGIIEYVEGSCKCPPVDLVAQRELVTSTQDTLTLKTTSTEWHLNIVPPMMSGQIICQNHCKERNF